MYNQELPKRTPPDKRSDEKTIWRQERIPPNDIGGDRQSHLEGKQSTRSPKSLEPLLDNAGSTIRKFAKDFGASSGKY